MVVKLRGKIDGKDVLFERMDGEHWSASIPHGDRGYYIVELEAYDEAGNCSYMAKFLLTFHSDALTVKLELYKYQVGLMLSDYLVECSSSPYFPELVSGWKNDELEYGTWRTAACWNRDTQHQEGRI